MGRKLAAPLDARPVSANSNEVVLSNGRRAVIKACSPTNDSFGVTAKMLPRPDEILVAVESDRGDVEIWRLSPDQFQATMRESPSAASRGVDTKLVRKRFAITNGVAAGSFTKAQLDAEG
ncbi:hypothetical protein [Caulobacter sp. AP07]|uniref:hypothetical protein n=1 Tax=Caulobacter sp. AP07 TaxID=1144304 RepID=UPI0012FC1787|nr:hypothetical protein [Caulobacter sp. AP07]